MRILHRLIYISEYIIGSIAFIIIIIGALDSGKIKSIPMYSIYENLGIASLIIYLLLFISSLIIKNIFWYKFQKLNKLKLIPKWLFLIIPVVSIFLPKIALLIEIKRFRIKQMNLYLVSIFLYLFSIFMILSATNDFFITDFIFRNLETVVGFYEAGPILIFLIFSASHLIYGYLLKSVNINISKSIVNDIELIGQNQ